MNISILKGAVYTAPLLFYNTVMDLPTSYNQTLSMMPDLAFGEDRNAFTKRVIDWGRENDIGTIECLRCATIKWEAWEIERLIIEIEDGEPEALKKAVIRLLKDRYIP